MNRQLSDRIVSDQRNRLWPQKGESVLSRTEVWFFSGVLLIDHRSLSL